MADPTPAPAAAPAPTAHDAEPTKTTPGRDQESGRFTRDGRGQPAPKAPAQPEPPRRYKLHTGEEVDEEELLAQASEKRLEGRALQARLKRLEELEALEAKRRKDPLDGLSREERRRLAVLEAKAWQEEQEEANLPPEQKALRQRERQLREREEALRAQEEKRQQEAEQAQMEQLREEAVETVKNAVKLAGLPETPGTYKRLFGIMANATRSGVAFPPEVLARKLRASYESDVQADFKALGGAKVLQRFPGLVELLNGVEDPEVLKVLAPLGERLRKLALEGRGLAPAAPAQDNVRHLPPPAPKPGQRVDPYEAQRRINERARK